MQVDQLTAVKNELSEQVNKFLWYDILLCMYLCMDGLGWVGLGRVGLGWVGLGWVGLGWVGLGWVGMEWNGMGWMEESCFQKVTSKKFKNKLWQFAAFFESNSTCGMIFFVPNGTTSHVKLQNFLFQKKYTE